MTLRSLMKYYCGKWERPLILFGFTIGFLAVSIQTELFVYQIICLVLSCITMLGAIAAIVHQLVKRNWFNALLTVLMLGGIVIAFSFYAVMSFFIAQSIPDQFTKNLKIPTDVTLNTPIEIDVDKQMSDSIRNAPKNQIDFQLYSSFQPGLYEYDVWVKKIDNGTLYLKAYEITQNLSLSTDRLAKRSTVQVHNATDSLQKFGTRDHFTIYEGDWGHPYAARFEVWFKPADGRDEQKLIEKNYKIEGWMR